ncbi:uncharacterized protein LOC141701135 [Apium graveolens]|uniref:uncharacterized protein LOC141701135 n=1 Tax=Apium graveolens TaxID=4045 RepID=UPI003D7C0651
MNFAAWNVRGINKSPHQKELQQFISVNNIDLMGILETKVKVSNALSISKKINKNWQWLFNYDHHYNGRIWVGWNPNVWEISLLSKSSQFITCNARFIEKNLHFIVTFVYAFNDAIDRVPLWEYISSNCSSPLPWAFLGDFNCITSLSEVVGGREHWTPEMQCFKDCLNNCGLEPLRTVGDTYTWTNKRLQDPVFKRLDRMVANSTWFNVFTEGSVFVKNRGIMDHNPLLFEEPMQLNKFGKPFQFFNFMIDIPGFLDIVSSAWSIHCIGSPIAQFNAKLKHTKLLLRKLNKDHGNILSNVHHARVSLEEFQASCASVAVNYFSQLLGTPASPGINVDLSMVNCKEVSAEQSNFLVAPVTDNHIFDIIKKMKKNKAPGPDGVNVEFFLATWHNTGASFCAAVRYFFEHGLMPSAIRLKKIMPALVDISQSAFIPGRSISDNILMAQELFRGYERETGVPKCALKIDLHKAFDSIHWSFILAVLKKMKFPDIMIGWIRACICSTRFSVKLNGIIHGYFKGTKGLRQGDPMSPYIFALCMNILSCTLNNTPEGFKYHWRCKELRLTHLFFADDVLVFSRGSKQSVQHIMDSIKTFSGWSGLAPSINKSTSFLCNCDAEFSSWFDTLSIPRGTLPVKFLGVPLISSQLSVNDCMPLVEKITSRLHSWATLLLSLAGRVLLIKSIVHAIEAFWCNHFLLPASIHATIQSLLTRFLWKGNINSKGGAKVAWNVICLPREEGGLGLKNMADWNRAQVIHHLVKVVLKLRVVALQFLTYSIGSGADISLWFDPWWGGTCLAETTTSPIISQCGLHRNASLSSIIHNGSWRLPSPNPRYHHLDPLLVHWLQTFDYPTINSNGVDTLLWDGTAATKIRTWHIWNSIRSRGDAVPWFKAVWHRLRVTRYAHHQWLLCHGRLNTLSRLYRFGLVDSQQCFLCISGRETDSHLFVHCTYSRWVLSRLLGRLDMVIVGDTWLSLLTHLADFQDNYRGLLALCLVQIYCYHIWRERNSRAHNKGVFGPRKLLHGILIDFVARLSTSAWFSKLACNRPDLHSCISCISL